jgi:ATP-binding cassette subfamily B protein
MYLNQAMGQASEAVNRTEDLTNVKPLPLASDPKPITGQEICFNEVSFSYPGSEQKAIDRISFTIREGKTYALVGASGGGKTTIARLVSRFWDVDSGQVSIGGIDVRDIAPEDLMKHVSFVFQNTRLFKTTVLENRRYGNPHATSEAIERAVDMAQCRELVNHLPDGLNTRIGVNGTYLSGGEQQRIALARAILKDAPIVVLDEATAFSDPENEHLIKMALRKLTEGKTVLMIAHRLTSVMDVDSILVIDKGKIAEQGKHDELLNKRGTYARMWNEFQKSVQWTVGEEALHA